MRRMRIAVLMIAGFRRATRYGVVCRGRDGMYYGYTWQARIAVCGAASQSQCADWLARTVMRRPA